jgi:hypothetical protein
MTDPGRPPAAWAEANQRDLVLALDRVRALLARSIGAEAPGDPAEPASTDMPPDGAADTEAFALGMLVRIFGLSAFERDVIALCAGVELDARIAGLVAATQGEGGPRLPTFGLALAAFPDAHWSAIAPTAPLRGWRLAELTGSSATGSGLRIDERILHLLVGINQLDERLRGTLAEIDPPASLTSRAEAIASAVADRLASDADEAVQVTGTDPEERLAVVARAGEMIGATMLRIMDSDLPDRSDERVELARLCGREWLLARGIVVVDADSARSGERIAALAGELRAPFVVCGREPIPALAARAPAFEVPSPTRDERLAIWRDVLGQRGSELNGALTRAAAQFDLGRGAMRMAAARAGGGDLGDDALWDACRVASRPRMDGLAQRIDAVAGWDDLVLPEQPRAVLRVIAAQVRQRHRVYEEWGFAARSARGLGITALFVGESGTGKTMAAEVLAHELRLDLFRIDLASVVSKYIGETERNLRQLFDAAEGSGAILLFDEADALFGRRSEVRDSHDRYANVEVSYLLQRMEAYRGLAILTTNMKQALDPAFLRRIRFIVRFPFPDAGLRAAIWRGIFPGRTPTGELDFEQLAQLNVSGGYIRNIALGGAFLAADGEAPVSMHHLAAAARAEYAKLERPLSAAETRGWP